MTLTGMRRVNIALAVLNALILAALLFFGSAAVPKPKASEICNSLAGKMIYLHKKREVRCLVLV